MHQNLLLYNVHLLHEILVYPPKMYLPTLIIVTVEPLPLHREWNVLAAQPSTDARQQRFHREMTLFVTGLSQLLKEVKWFLLFPTMTEFSKAKKKQSSLTCSQNSYYMAKVKRLKVWHQLNYCHLQGWISKKSNIANDWRKSADTCIWFAIRNFKHETPVNTQVFKCKFMSAPYRQWLYSSHCFFLWY